MSVAFSHKNSPNQNIHQSNAWYFSSICIFQHSVHRASQCPWPGAVCRDSPATERPDHPRIHQPIGTEQGRDIRTFSWTEGPSSRPNASRCSNSQICSQVTTRKVCFIRFLSKSNIQYCSQIYLLIKTKYSKPLESSCSSLTLMAFKTQFDTSKT